MFKKIGVLFVFIAFLFIVCLATGCANEKSDAKKYVGHYEGYTDNYTNTLVLREDGTFESTTYTLVPSGITDSGDWWIKDNKIVFQAKGSSQKTSCSLDVDWDKKLTAKGKQRYGNCKVIFGPAFNVSIWGKVD